MNRVLKKAAALCMGTVMLGGTAALAACSQEQEVNPNIGFMVEVTVDPGHTIYEPEGSWGYRYGPSLMYNDDGVLEGWFSGPPATGREWDDLFYWTSADYGQTWGEEQVGVKPIAGTREEYSACDPTVFKYGGYYYALYSSTIESMGRYNDVYGSRSTSPTGPWEKWDGEAWVPEAEADPQPIVFYGSNAEFYGIGEPSAVILGDHIYLYYSYNGILPNGAEVHQTRVAIGDITREDWPNTLEYKGVAVGEKDSEEDSLDVKYIDGYDMFLGVTTRKRFSTQSSIQFYQSFDGITFYEIYSCDDSNAELRLHNIGMTGDEQGHIDLSVPQYVSYAYATDGLNWGFWNTAINRIHIKITQIVNLKEVLGETVTIEGTFPDGQAPAIWGLSTSSDTRTAEKALDGNPISFYSSMIHTGVDSSSNKYHSGKYFAEALAMTAPSGSASGIKLTPREDLYCFPSKFVLQYSDDGINWTDIRTYSDYAVTDSTEKVFEFGETIEAKYFRVYALELTADQFGSYALQIAEMALI